MSYLKLRRTQEIGVEVNAECQVCGSGLLSEATEGAWQDRPLGSGVRIVVKVPPFCVRCQRERDEALKDVKGTAWAILQGNHREGV